MAEAATLARPYAKAAFASARDSHALREWSEAFRSSTELLGEPRVAAALGDPKTSIDQVVALFDATPEVRSATADVGSATLDGHWQNFMRLLATNKRLDVLPQIAQQFELLRADHENEVDVQVTSAAPMTEPQRSKIAAALKRRFKRDVRMSTAVDPALLGGAIIRAGDLVIDGSINGRLQRMASDLAN